MALAARETLGHYRLIDKLGEGGMGEVWRARDTRLERDVALKLLPGAMAADKERRDRFRHEARALAALSHPHIVTIHSVEEVSGRHFLTMELVDGHTLADLIPACGWSAGRVLEVAIPLADAVASAHARGMVHRDLKPRNIMVSRRGEVKVLDFGLAQSAPAAALDADSLASTASVTALRVGGGTPLYMSPEQLRGQVTDSRTDIFSLGVVLHEMASGQPPFRGETLADVVAAILKEPPECLCDLKPELPRQLWRIIRRCLEKEPERRLQTALDLRNELQDLARELATGASGQERSVAVLPFADLSADKDQGHFCDGIAEEILSALGRIQGLRVASRLSAFRFQAGEAGSRDVGRRLGVDTLLEGSVRKAGDRLRITVRLTDVEQGYQLWSEVYDRQVSDIFAIQDEIAHRVVEALEVRLRPGERAGLTTTRTRDVAAYDFYLRGRSYFYQYRRQGVEDALQMFKEAIRRDPGYALAYAGMADCSAYLFMYAARDESHRQEALSSSLRALELDPDLAQAHASHGTALSLLGRHQEAEEAFERALRLDPDLFEAYYFYARDCFVQGKFERALKLYGKAVAARPEDYQASLLMAQLYDDTGRSAEAEKARRQGIKVAEEHLRLHPDDTRAMYLSANAMVALDQVEEGLRLARRALARDPDEPMLLYNVGCILSMAGRQDEALDALDRAVANGITQREWFEHDSNLDALRGHPRFLALMGRLVE